MRIMKEFRDFAVRGNVVDLTVGVIIGAAFAKIVDSVINDLVLPLVGKLAGNVDFSNLYIRLSGSIPEGLSLAEARALGPVFAYGHFLSVLVNFLILSFCVFLMVKAINSLRDKKEKEDPPSRQELLLTEIRDALKEKK